MRIRSLALAAAALVLVTTAAAADEAKTGASAPKSDAAKAAAPAPSSSAKQAHVMAGDKKWKDRINLIARKPLRRDLDYTSSRDRSSWNGFTTWQGIRDKRPMIARKTMGFHAPRPHRTREERVLMLSRGPIKGPAFSE